MKAPNDRKTADILGETHDLAGERPRAPTAREKGRARVQRYREKNGLKAITVNLPAELVEQFHEKRRVRGQTANEAIETLLRTQYLRKR